MNIHKTGQVKNTGEEPVCSEKTCTNCFDNSGCMYHFQRMINEAAVNRKKKSRFPIKKNWYLFLLLNLLLPACAADVKGNDASASILVDNIKPEKGYAKGRVTDGKGKPLAGVSIYVDNTIYFNSGVSTITDANGYYRVEVPQGAWRVYAQMEINYNGKRFKKIELHPDNARSFSGTDGVVCNFQWKLTGEKPIPMVGFYGGLVNLYNDPNGDMYDVENIEFTFTPDGPLIDGSTGTVIKAKSGRPRSATYSKINDIPMGKYIVTAKHVPTGKALKLADNNGDGEFSSSLTIGFEPELNFCDRCMTIMYSDR